MMRRLAAGGRTLVLVTHHIEDVVREVDRVVLMAGGEIVADGPKGCVLSSERLSELFGVPLLLEERDAEYRLW
jgi:iron complex transport system ATP-binding protein